MKAATRILVLVLLMSSAVLGQVRGDTEICRDQLTDGRDAYEEDRWIDAAVFVYAYLICADRPLSAEIDGQLRLVYEFAYSKAVGQAAGFTMEGKMFIDKPEYPKLP